jgi:hypothetical protein
VKGAVEDVGEIRQGAHRLSRAEEEVVPMDKDDASGADSGNDVAPVVVDLLAGPSAKLSEPRETASAV